MKKFIGVFVSLVFVGVLVYLMRDQVPAVIGVFKNGNRALIGLAALLFLAGMAFMAYRLKLIFQAKGMRVSFKETLDLTFIGCFFNNFLPTSVGGDVVKAMCASQITKHPVKSITVIMMDRIFGLFMFILIPSASLLLLRDQVNPKVPVIVYSFLGFSAAAFFLLFNSSVAKRFHLVENLLNRIKIGSKIRQIYDGLHDFKNHRGIMVSAMALSVAGQSLNIFVLYLLAVALGADSSTLLYFFLLIPVVHLLSMLPPTLGGLGVREGLYTYFLKGYIGTERAFALGILWLGLLLLSSLIGGIIYVARSDYHVQFNKKSNPEGQTP